MAIDTLDNVKLNLHITKTDDDTLLGLLQDAADSFIASYCDRIFTGGSFSEDHAGGSRFLFLKNFPLASVDSVNVDANRSFTDATILDPSRYVVYGDRGVIESLAGPFLGASNGNSFPAAVRVAYSTPADAVPNAIQRVYAELIGHWYRQAITADAAGQQNLLKQTNDATVTKYPWGQSGGFALPNGVQQVLDQFRVPL